MSEAEGLIPLSLDELDSVTGGTNGIVNEICYLMCPECKKFVNMKVYNGSNLYATCKECKNSFNIKISENTKYEITSINSKNKIHNKHEKSEIHENKQKKVTKNTNVN